MWLQSFRYKLKNIKETEASKKLLQEKRLMGRTNESLAFLQVTVQIISNMAWITLPNLVEVSDCYFCTFDLIVSFIFFC